MARKRLGELLLERGAISPAQLDAARLAHQRTRQRLGATLVAQGAITEACGWWPWRIRSTPRPCKSYYHRDAPARTTSSSGLPLASEEDVEEIILGEEEGAGEEVIVGEELPSAEMTRRVSLEQLIQEREQKRRGTRRGPARRAPSGDVSAALDSLFGESHSPGSAVDPVEELERKFWALMRIMARKGLLTNEEFTRELDDEPDA